jgi:hypothetical protein
MSVGQEKSNGFHESAEEAIKQAAELQEHAADVQPADVEFVPRSGPCPKLRELPPSAGCARAAEAHGGELGDLIKLRGSMHSEFRTEVAVAGVTVSGVLPATARPTVGSIAISGDVYRLSCDLALELVDALLLVVTRMDIILEERYSATATATRDRSD